MQSRKVKPEPNITEAAEKTGLLIKGLQSRLLESAAEAEEQSGDTVNLERQLEDYFARWPGESPGSPLNRIRNRVIEGVVDRILRGWQQDGKAHPFENEVIERLIDGVLDMLSANGKEPVRKPGSFSSGPKSTTTHLSGSQM